MTVSTVRMTRRMVAVLGLASASVFAQAALPTPAAAQNPATLPVSVISMIGRNAPAPYIDPALSKFAAQLTKPPLSSFNSYTQLAATTVSTPLGGSASSTLPNKQPLQLSLAAKPDASGRYVMHAIIGGKTLDLTMPQKKTLFVGGQKYNDGKGDQDMVLAFTVNP